MDWCLFKGVRADLPAYVRSVKCESVKHFLSANCTMISDFRMTILLVLCIFSRLRRTLS